MLLVSTNKMRIEMKKRIRLKQQKSQLYSLHRCKGKISRLNSYSFTDELLGEIEFDGVVYVCSKCEMLCLSEEASQNQKKAINKAQTNLLLKHFHPDDHEYLSIKEVSELTGLSEKYLAIGDYFMNSLLYKGERIYLKESVDKFLRTKTNGAIKLVDYSTKNGTDIKRIFLHDNYDIDVEFYDGSFKRRNVRKLIWNDSNMLLLRDLNVFKNPTEVYTYKIEYPMWNEISSLYLYQGKNIPPFTGGIEPREW